MIETEPELELLEEPGDGVRGDMNADLLQRLGDFLRGLPGPFQTADWLTSGLIPHDPLDFFEDFGRFFGSSRNLYQTILSIL